MMLTLLLGLAHAGPYDLVLTTPVAQGDSGIVAMLDPVVHPSLAETYEAYNGGWLAVRVTPTGVEVRDVAPAGSSPLGVFDIDGDGDVELLDLDGGLRALDPLTGQVVFQLPATVDILGVYDLDGTGVPWILGRNGSELLVMATDGRVVSSVQLAGDVVDVLQNDGDPAREILTDAGAVLEGSALTLEPDRLVGGRAADTVDACDIDGDGIEERLTYTARQWSVWSGDTLLWSHVDPTPSRGSASGGLFDLDGDGTCEAVLPTVISGREGYMVRDGDGRPTAGMTSLDGDVRCTTLSPFDVDGDGLMEVGCDAYGLYLDPQNQRIATVEPLLGTTWTADLDGDGTEELILVNDSLRVMDPSTLQVLTQQPLPSRRATLRLQDVEDDGITELLVGRDGLHVWSWDASTGFARQQTLWASQDDLESPVVLDVNGDGAFEALSCAISDDAPAAVWLRLRLVDLTTGDELWGSEPCVRAWGEDLDGDGSLEILYRFGTDFWVADPGTGLAGSPLPGVLTYSFIERGGRTELAVQRTVGQTDLMRWTGTAWRQVASAPVVGVVEAGRIWTSDSTGVTATSPIDQTRWRFEGAAGGDVSVMGDRVFIHGGVADTVWDLPTP